MNGYPAITTNLEHPLHIDFPLIGYAYTMCKLYCLKGKQTLYYILLLTNLLLHFNLSTFLTEFSNSCMKKCNGDHKTVVTLYNPEKEYRVSVFFRSDRLTGSSRAARYKRGGRNGKLWGPNSRRPIWKSHPSISSIFGRSADLYLRFAGHEKCNR